MTIGWIAAGIAIAVWGVTFASTRVLLEEFSALEINIVRFALAWVALACASKMPKKGEARAKGERRYGCCPTVR